MNNIKGFDEFDGSGINEGWLTNIFKGWFNPSQASTAKSGSAFKKITKTTQKGFFDRLFDILKKQREQINKQAKAKASFNKADYWTLITVIACENYATEEVGKQGMSDTAQSIYNRYNVPGKPYGKTIKEIILSPGQYAVVAEGIRKGAKWKEIDTMQDAIDVYAKTKGVDLKKASTAISAAVEAQKNSTLATNAGKYVQSRTEFLTDKPTAAGAKSPVERPATGKNNAFFWNYAGKKYFYSKNDLAPKAKPDSVKVV